MNSISLQADPNKLLTPDQITKILAVCARRAENDLTHGRKSWVTRSMLVNLAFKSGLKVGEISGLKIKDLRMESPDCCIQVDNGKNTLPRSVFIFPGLVHQIRYYLNLRRFSWGENLEGGHCLLSPKDGLQYTTAALNFSFKKAIEAAGFESRYTIQNARHSYAVLLLEKTNDLQFVKSQLGHVKKASTAQYLDFKSICSKEAALEILS